MINIEKYLQHELYNSPKRCIEKEDLVPKNCNHRYVYSTFINRCYHGFYLHACEWLEDKSLSL